MANFKELSEKLEIGKMYTLWKMGEFGFPYKVQFKLTKVVSEPYAQYSESLVLGFVPKGKRKATGIRFYGNYMEFAIWEGLVEVNSEMYVKTKESFGMTVKESLSGFSGEYLDRALGSVSEKPLIVVKGKE